MFCCCTSDDAGTNVEPIAQESAPSPGTDEREKVLEAAPPPEKVLEEKIEEKAQDPEPAKVEEPPAPAPEPEAPKVEEKAKDPEPYYYEFQVTRNGTGLGLKLAQSHGKCFYVSGIMAGSAIDSYNAGADPSKKVQVSDMIVEANGKTSMDEIVKATKEQSQLTFKMYRPVPQKVTFDKGDKAVGLNLTIQDGNVTMSVGGFGEGAAKDYNASAPPERRIEVGDYITSVNGVGGTTTQMIEEIKAAKTLEFTIVRPL